MKKYMGLLLMVPSLVGVCLFYVLPFLGSLYYTFTQGVAEPRFVGLQNFRELSHNPVFRRAVTNTGLFLALGVPLVLLLALGLSVIASKRPLRWQRWALLLPLVVPSASLALGWQSFWGEGGLVNQTLVCLSLPAGDFLNGPASFPLLLTLYLLKNTGYLSVILTSAILSLPVAYRESYRLESNGEVGYIRHILLPLIAPSVLFCSVVAIMNYFLLFRDIYAIYGENPPAQLYMLQHFMNNNFYNLNYQRLSAAAFLTVLCLSAFIAVILLLQRSVKRHVG